MAVQSIQYQTLSADVNSVNRTEVNIDKDLVELAGSHAYNHPPKDTFIEINENYYKVLNVNKDSETGLDAFVIKNVNDKNNENLIIVYVGSEQVEQDWLGKDANFTLSTPGRTTSIICS